ncbi:hypothetical protein JR316_0008800 [Psilocybe cubensis]|uniref:Uncharacterized protein n=2 Tax=Psilocybe cubensis TaxID=181762 RepID=A0A8H7XVU5_PSICU|nr:hypothetical protein JR316_0008800 [Psilocybe cubensis]KAH9478346.1 hypothetical protein JR316_0008800 [Psilocybe cubensis]
MALGLSRSRIGVVLNQQGLSVRLASPLQAASCVHSGIALSRTYTTASASLTKKTPVTAKGTRKDAHLSPPPPKQKAASRNPPKKATSREMESAKHVADEEPLPTKISEEEKLKEVERMLAFQHLMPTVDAWGQEIKETLDVMIPLSVNYREPKAAFSSLQKNVINSLKNISSLAALINENALPGLYHGSGFMARIRQMMQIFRTQSVEADAIMAPVREMALNNYQALNNAIASRADKEVRKYTTSGYLNQSLQLSKTFRSKIPPKGRMIWQMHRTITPVQVLSLRVTEGYLAPEPPKLGNRLMVHALVKFDTEQSLEIYDARGNPLHTVVTNPDRMIDSEQPKESWRVPAPRKRVTEYLVLEKKMWHQGPWQFREQLWPF